MKRCLPDKENLPPEPDLPESSALGSGGCMERMLKSPRLTDIDAEAPPVVVLGNELFSTPPGCIGFALLGEIAHRSL